MRNWQTLVQQVSRMPRQELLREVHTWQESLCRPTPKQRAALAELPLPQLQARVVRIRAHVGLDAAGRQQVNQDLQAQGILRWVGRDPRSGHWTLG